MKSIYKITALLQLLFQNVIQIPIQLFLNKDFLYLIPTEVKFKVNSLWQIKMQLLLL